MAPAPNQLIFGGGLRGVARATVHARREGGFLGIGSVRVSDDEHAAISRIAAALTA